jgi:hypothetical protein
MECTVAILIGAVTLSFTWNVDWMVLAVCVALLVLGPANIGLTFLIWLSRDDEHWGTGWTRFALVSAKILVSLVLFPLLVFCVLVAAVLFALAWLFLHG